MKLTQELAQKIVNKSISVLDKNVNIMNNEGIILASGDDTRIGKLHEVAAMVMKNKKRIIINKENIKKFNYDGVKPGINLPIKFQNKVIGVVGITGDPKVVQKFGEVLKNMVELTLERDLLYQEINSKYSSKENFYQRLLNKDLEKQKIDIEERANIYNITTKKFRNVIVVNYTAKHNVIILKEFNERVNFTSFESNIEFVLLREDKLIIILSTGSAGKEISKKSLKKDANTIIDILSNVEGIKDISLGVGSNIEDIKHLNVSYQNAKLTSEIGNKIFSNKISYFKDLKYNFILSFLNKDIAETYYEYIFNKKPKENETFQIAYSGEIADNLLRNNLNISKTAKEMHIHRNTLEYRINKIKNLTGLDLKNLEDLFAFILAYRIYQYYL